MLVSPYGEGAPCPDLGNGLNTRVQALEKQTEGLDTWTNRIREAPIEDENGLRAWLSAQGVTSYAQSLLVMERFGYPDFILATADELIEKQ